MAILSPSVIVTTCVLRCAVVVNVLPPAWAKLAEFYVGEFSVDISDVDVVDELPSIDSVWIHGHNGATFAVATGSVDETFIAWALAGVRIREHFGYGDSKVFEGTMEVAAVVVSDVFFDDFCASMFGLKFCQQVGYLFVRCYRFFSFLKIFINLNQFGSEAFEGKSRFVAVIKFFECVHGVDRTLFLLVATFVVFVQGVPSGAAILGAIVRLNPSPSGGIDDQFHKETVGSLVVFTEGLAGQWWGIQCPFSGVHVCQGS